MSGEIKVITDPRSITPNQDVAAQFLVRVRRRLRGRTQRPGMEGMIARMQMVLLADLGTIVSAERDAGQTDRDIRTTLAVAIGDLVASATLTLGGGRDAPLEETLDLFVDVLRGRALEAMGEGEAEHISYQQPEAGKG